MDEKQAERFGITQFNGTGFDNWKYRVGIMLDHYEVLHCIESEEENPDATFIKADKKCKAILVQCISNSQLQHIKDKKTSYQIWQALEAVFQRKGIASQLYLRRKLLAMKLKAGTKLETHFNLFDETIRELISVGAKLEKLDIICHLLLTLSKSFDPIVTALETLEPGKLTLEFVKGKLLDYEMKRCHMEKEEQATTSAFAVKPSYHKHQQSYGKKFHKEEKKYKCHNCGKEGHFRRNCPERQANCTSGQLEDEGSQFAFSAGANQVSMEEADESTIVSWYLDSAATDHMVNSEKYFASSKDLSTPIKVCVAKSSENIVAKKIGEISVNVNQKESIIKNVLFIEELRNNLLSVKKLCEAGCKVEFNKNNAKIMLGSTLIANAVLVGGMFKVNFGIIRKSANSCLKSNFNNTELWHKRMGHLGIDNLKRLYNQKMVDGIQNISNLESMCRICVESKMSKLPFNKDRKCRSKDVLEIVHTDVCGPITPTTYDGHRYMITFLDDYTHFSAVYLMKQKSDAFVCFRKYHSYVTNQLKKNIVTLICDNGREYCSNEMNRFCTDKGINVKFTIPYTPQLNGVAERLNRTLLERGRALILEAELPKDLWGEAILCATYLLNRSPTTALTSNKTPSELFYGKKPNLKYLRTFGSVAYKHIPKERAGGKFEPKTESLIMIGYTHNGYKLWNPEKGKIELGRDVLFDETKNINDISKADKCHCQNTLETETLVELSDSESEINENELNEPNLGRGKRNRKLPARYDDYEVNAMSAVAYIDNVPTTLEDAKNRADYAQWKNAVDTELNMLYKNDTWTLTKRPEKAHVIDSKWVFKRKENNGILIYKARLVARGFKQRNGLDYEETYSPVAKLTTLRILLATINHKQLYARQMDVKSAFLHGFLKEEIYMAVPEGIDTASDQVCRLNKALYGLKQAPHCWNQRFNEFMKTLKFEISQNDECLFIKESTVSTTYLLLYVDDIIIASTGKTEMLSIKGKLETEFDMTDIGDIKEFLGIEITRSENGLELSQTKYLTKVLDKFGMLDCHPTNLPMEAKVNPGEGEEVVDKPVKELIGCLLYAVMGTRPDLSFALNVCSRYQTKPTVLLWQALKKILRYVKGTLDFKLKYEKNSETDVLVGYADADWAGDEDRKSTTGFTFQVFGNTVCWSTRKQSTVALSSTEAEYVALSEAAREGVWLRNLITELVSAKPIIIIYEDNQGCIKLSQRKDHKRLKHVDVKFNFIKDLVKCNNVKLRYIETINQTADILTKNLRGSSFQKHRAGLGLIE